MIFPRLILDLSLHGDLAYYSSALSTFHHLREHSLLSSPLYHGVALKTQIWLESDSPYYRTVCERHGRPPLPSLTPSELIRLLDIAASYNIQLGVTAHDRTSLDLLLSLRYRFRTLFIKFGAHDTLNIIFDLRSFLTYHFDTPFILSLENENLLPWLENEDRLNRLTLLPNARFLSTSSVYPNPLPWDGTLDGFSCHATPSLLPTLLSSAYNAGAALCEAHTTLLAPRGPFPAPLYFFPGDFPCSYPLLDLPILLRALPSLVDDH